VGYRLWKSDKPFLATDLHAVWQRNHEDLICVTPQAKDDKEIAFLPLEFDVNYEYGLEVKASREHVQSLTARARPFCDAAMLEVQGDDNQRRYWHEKAQRYYDKL